jgi:hypothetical protein
MSSRRYASAGPEPSLREMLADPIVHAVMRRDGITREELVAVVERAARAIRAGALDSAKESADGCWRVSCTGNSTRDLENGRDPGREEVRPLTQSA